MPTNRTSQAPWAGIFINTENVDLPAYPQTLSPAYSPHSTEPPPSYFNAENTTVSDRKLSSSASEAAVVELLSENSLIDYNTDDFKRLVSLELRSEQIAYISFMKENYDLSGYDGMAFTTLRSYVDSMDPVAKAATLTNLESEWIRRKDPQRERKVRGGAVASSAEQGEIVVVRNRQHRKRTERLCCAYLIMAPICILIVVLVLHFLIAGRNDPDPVPTVNTTSSMDAAVKYPEATTIAG
jgi:hypothetical protein